MVVIASLLVIALIGFIVAISYIIAVAIGFRKVPGRAQRLVQPPTDSAIELYNTGKGIVEVAKIRYAGYAKQGSRISVAVKETSEQVGAAAQTINVKGAASTLKNAAATVNAAQESLAAAKALLDALGKYKSDK